MSTQVPRKLEKAQRRTPGARNILCTLEFYFAPFARKLGWLRNGLFQRSRADYLASHMDQQLRSVLKLQFFTTLDRQRACAARAAKNQSDRSTFAAAGDAANNRPGRSPDTTALDCLFSAAARLDTPFVIGPARI